VIYARCEAHGDLTEDEVLGQEPDCRCLHCGTPVKVVGTALAYAPGRAPAGRDG
jgi:hypothetical protein